MLQRLIFPALLAAAAYWYWSGPYQAGKAPDYQQKLEHNQELMRLCIRTANFKAGATGNADGDPATRCAEQHGLYFADGQWHSYNDVRPH